MKKLKEELATNAGLLAKQHNRNMELEADILHMKNAMKEDDERLDAAAKKAHMSDHGYDTAGALADMVLSKERHHLEHHEELNQLSAARTPA